MIPQISFVWLIAIGCTEQKATKPLVPANSAEAPILVPASNEQAKALFQKKKFKDAFRMYVLVAEKGDAEAQQQLAVMSVLGQGTKKSFPEAVRWFTLAAEHGYAPSQFGLGLRYLNGEGVETNAVEAVKWFQKAADQKFAMAQFRLGLQYRDGAGVGKDVVAAYKWMRLGSLNGRPAADRQLSELIKQLTPEQITEGDRAVQDAQLAGLAPQNSYATGKALQKQKNYREALKLFGDLAQSGDAQAQYEMGVMQVLGQGGATNFVEGVKWFQLAAAQGNAEALFSLGFRYANGEGVTADPAEALKYFRKAAEKGCAPAQLRLGIQYRDGQDVATNVVEAFQWILLAAKTGRKDATLALDDLKKNMTAEEIAQGELRVKSFSPQQTASAK